MVKRWYGIVLGAVLGICLFMPGLEGRWLVWVASVVLVVNAALLLVSRVKEDKRFKDGIMEIMHYGQVNEQRNARVKRTLYELDKVMMYNDMIVFVSSLIFLLVNWTIFFERMHPS